MSACISRHGEYSEHTYETSGEHRFLCTHCWMLAEEAMFAALDAAEVERDRLREQISAVRADLDIEVRSGAPTVPVVAAAEEHIARRLRWPSMHWGTESVHSDAWPHVAHATAVGVLEHLTAALDTSTPATEGGEGSAITIPRPQILTGPKHQTVDEATASYLRDAAIRVRQQRYWGSGVTALVSDLLDNAADAIAGEAIDG